MNFGLIDQFNIYTFLGNEDRSIPVDVSITIAARHFHYKFYF